eukprot:c22406_g1_i1 orf=516-4535(+)
MMDCFSKEACTRGAFKGLPVLLHEDESHTEKGTVVGCFRDKCKTVLKEQTLNHVFKVSPHHGAAFTAGDEVNLQSIQSSLQMLLQNLPSHEEGSRDGVVIMDDGSGNGDVAVDKQSAVGDLKFMQGGLVLESQAAFSSVRSNACISRGKWMYEVTLETAGIQQLGWATRSCKFTREEGVGDSTDSYAYDGRRVRKWSVSWHSYGQPWVSGDVIGCCINLDKGEISFLRNGVSLGVAFTEVGNSDPKLPYYPAISLSQGERCDLNFGGRPFRYPVEGFEPIQAPPLMKDTRLPVLTQAQYLLGCLQRLLQLDSKEVVAAMAPEERLRRLKPLGEDSYLVGKEICKSLAKLLMEECQSIRSLEYVTWGALVSSLMELHRLQPPHDVLSVDTALDLILSFLDSNIARSCICIVMDALAFGCRTSSITLAESPFTGSYPYLSLAIHLLRRKDILMHWCRFGSFELCLEGLLSKKGPNKYDLERLMPTVWWPGSREDSCTKNNMQQTAQALSKAIDKVEELQWELSHCLLEFVPNSSTGAGPSDLLAKSTHPSGSMFMSFLRHLVGKNRGAARNMPPPGLSDNSVLMTAYTVLLRFLSEGVPSSSVKTARKEQDADVGFLHRGGSRSFNVQLFLDAESYASDFARLGGTFSHLLKAHILAPDDCDPIVWEEGCMENDEKKVTHLGKQKPCCCPGLSGSPVSCGKVFVRVLNKGFNIHVNSVSESRGATRPDQGRRNCTEDEDEKPSSSGRVEPLYSSSSYHNLKKNSCKAFVSDAVQEEELLDIMVLLYHLGVAPNFKQASYYLQHQLQYITQLDDTDRQIRTEKASSDHLKRLKEARAVYREDLIECVRQSTWYRVSLFSKWKQRGMFATCMWIVQLLLVLSKRDALFSFVPEYYVETLLDCFHALRRSDPLFVSPTALLQQGLSPLITFLVTHFNDTRIANSDIRDALLQSISVLVQYKEHVVAFESNAAATEVMPAALLSAFDNRFWIPVTNILLRLCKGTGFGSSKSSTHGESCSPTFQALLRERCIQDEKLFSSFLNRLFNTLNWTITEFSVSMKELQEQSEHRQVADLQQRKCSIMFELSCNLERILEFFTRELPQAFLSGPEMNLVRLCELLMFVLNHTTTTADATFFESTLRHQGQSLEKINRAMILAPLVGIILNLSAAKESVQYARHDVAQAILNVDVSSVATGNFEYLVEFSWGTAFKGDPSLARLPDLKDFLRQLKIEASAVKQRELEEDSVATVFDYEHGNTTGDEKEDICSICYACEINTIFHPCSHKSCWRCISRHLLNNQRCFFCNATVQDLRSMSVMPASAHNQFGDSEAPKGVVGESGLLFKMDSP